MLHDQLQIHLLLQHAVTVQPGPAVKALPLDSRACNATRHTFGLQGMQMQHAVQQGITFDSRGEAACRCEDEALLATTPPDLLLQLMLYAAGLTHIVAACMSHPQ